MANPKRTYSTVYNALKQISDEEGIDFGLGGYTEQQFKDKYFTGPGNINNLYNKLSQISDEEGVDFGLGTRGEWLGSFGYTEEDAMPKQGYKPTADDMADFNSTIKNAGRTAGSSLGSFDSRVQNLQKRQGLNVPNRIEVGKSNNLVQGRQQLNPETGQLENTYITSSGNEYENEVLADIEQRQIDQYARDERYKQSLPGQLDDAYAERDRLNAELGKLQGQWVDQDGRVHYGNRENDEAAASLEAALRQNQQRITALEAERDDDGGTQFWRGFIDAAQNPSTKSFGMTDFDDMIQMMRIKSKMDAAIESGQEPRLSDAEQALLQSSYLNNYAQSQYGENRGFMYRAGGISMQALPFVAEFMATGGMGAISQKGAELGTRAAEKLALQGLSRSLVKNLGVVAGDVAAGWAMANTTGLFRTAGDVMQRNIGGVTINPEGNYDFGQYDEEGNYQRGGKSLGRSIYEAEVANTLEYYTEKLGEHLQIGKWLAKGADKIGLSKLSKAVNYLSGNKWLERGGIQDYPSEVVEEEANLILNAALVGDNKFSELDPRSKTQMDIWGGMLFSIGLMQAPRLAYTGYSAAGYYTYKKGVDIADGNASVVFGADNWQMIKDEIDNCENDRLGELMQTVINGDMTDEQKTATLNYTKNLVKMRGYNMGMMAGAKDEEEATSNEGMAAQAVNQSYQQGHETQDPDLMKRFNDDILAAEQNLHQYGEEFAKEIVDASEIPVQELDYLMSSRNYFTDEQIAAAADYYTKQARAKGMMEGALDRIDLQVEDTNAYVRSITHQATGNVYWAKGADNIDYNIISGDIITDPDTGLPVLTGTGGAVVVKDPYGNVSVKSPQELKMYSMRNAEEMINYNNTELRQKLMQQADDDITYGSPANEVYQLEDTVTLNDGEGNTIEGTVVMMPNAVDGVYVLQTPDGKALQFTADQMNRMIVAHNGMEVQRGQQIADEGQTIENQQLEQTETESVPTVSNQEQPQPQPSQGGEQTGGEASAENGTGADEQPVSALSKIPVLTDDAGKPVLNKKGKPQYQWHKASVEDAAAALIETTGGDKLMARDTASDLVTNAKAGLEKIRKQKPKGDDPIEIAESRMEIKRQEQEQQDIIKHWQDVNQAIQKQMRDEAAARQAEIEAAKSEEQRKREAEEARLREEKQREIDRQRILEAIERDREKRNKEYQPLVDARKEMEGDDEALAILNDTEPRSLEEHVSSMIRPHSMLWQDASDSETGLQSELGLKRGDMQRMMSLLGNKESGAKPFGKVVLDIYEGLPEAMKDMYTDEDVRNTLLNLFGEGNSTRMMHLTEENRIAEARETMLENLRRDAEAEMEAWAETYHLTPEERETFEDFMSQEPALPNEQEFINQIIEDEEQNSRGQEVDLDNTSGTAGRESEGGEEQVQGESAAETAGADQEQPEPEQGAETPAGGQAVSDNNVPGGTVEKSAPYTSFEDMVADTDINVTDNEQKVHLRAIVDRIFEHGSSTTRKMPRGYTIKHVEWWAGLRKGEREYLKPWANNFMVSVEGVGKSATWVDEKEQAIYSIRYVPFGVIAKDIEAIIVSKKTLTEPTAKAGVEVKQEKPKRTALDSPEGEILVKGGTKLYSDDSIIKVIGSNIDHNTNSRYYTCALYDSQESYKNDNRTTTFKIKQQDMRNNLDNGTYSKKQPVKQEPETKAKNKPEPKTPWWNDPNRPKSITPSDYKTYMTDEAKEYFANFKSEDGKTDFTNWAHPNLAYITAAVWDEVEIPYEDLKNVPEIVEAENTIKSAEAKGKLEISEEEANNLAQRLIDSGEARQEQKAFVIIGLPAGGKSSVFANPLSKQYGARIIDSDDVKPWLKGFDGGNGAGYVQDASAEVAEKAIDIAVKNGDNIVIPRIGGKSVMDLSAALRLSGYDVQLYFNDVKGVSSIDRAASRFAQTGRYLSLDYLTKKAGVPSENFSKFAEKTIGGYLDERNQKEVQDIRRRVQGLRGELYGSGSGLWESLAAKREGTGETEGSVQADLGGRGLQTGRDELSLLLTSPLFNYSEWKSNDVPIGQKPKEIWNSKSGQPMPVKEVKNNETESKVSAESGAAGEGTGQASGSADRTGAERGPESNRAERSGRGYSVGHKRIVSDSRMEELKKRLRSKLGWQLNVGVDPEVLAIGAEMAVGYLERGVTKFADFARTMIDEVGDFMRPYLKSFYNAVRDMPEAQEYAGEMDDYQTVSSFDVHNFDKQGTPDALVKAQQIVDEQKIRKEVAEITDGLDMKQTTINDITDETEEQTAADTAAIVSEAETLAGEARSAKSRERRTATIEKIDEQLEKIDNQLAFIGFYDVDPDAPYHESMGRMKSAEKKAVADATRVARRIAKDLGINAKPTAKANMAPIGGDISFRIPINDNTDMYFNLLMERGYESYPDSLEMDVSYFRLEDKNTKPQDNGRYRNYTNNFFGELTPYDELLNDVRQAIKQAGIELEEPNTEKQEPKKPASKKSKQQQANTEPSLFDMMFFDEEQPDNTLGATSSPEKIEEEEAKVDTNPTEAQKEAGNYQKGHIQIDGYDITIENPKGSVRRGTDASGNPWETEMHHTYGYIRGTEGVDGDHIDVFLSDDPTSGSVFVVDQVNPSTGEFDEHKCMYGFGSEEEAREAYLANYSKGWKGLGNITEVSREDFKKWVESSHRKTKPFADYSSVKKEPTNQAPKRELPKHNNKRNNVGERGQDYAPTSPKARFNANVEAVKMMRALIEDGVEAPTKDQMEVLRKYSGWGGMGTYFNDDSMAENKLLRELLTDEEYNDAVMSINSAYYTPATVIDTLWDVAKALGFKGGNVLEGSAGIGNIIGQMPKEISSRSDIEAVEIDTISGNILKLLYPDAKVHIDGFQDVRIPNGTVDLAVTNVPFVTGLHVIDKVDKDLSRKFTNIHDFCIAKNIRKLREGGIGIFITSSGTMDKSTKLREWIPDEGQSDVIGAFRLNNETFGGTNVTSDIIVVRKRVGGIKSNDAIDISKASPMRIGSYEDKYGNEKQTSMVVNDYFRDHPEMMAGEMAFGYEKGDTFRPGSYGLYPVDGKSQEKMMQDFVSQMKKVGVTTQVSQNVVQATPKAEPNQLTAEKEGRMLVDDKGRLCVSRYGTAEPLGLNEQKVKGYTKQECFKDYQDVQKAVDDVLQQQLNDPDDAALKPKLDALNKAYDKFTKRYGTLHKNTSISFLRNDIDFPSFQALENYSETKDMNGKVKVETKKAPLFTQRVLGFKTEPQPKNIKDAVTASLFRTNTIDMEWIADKLGKSVDDVKKEILESRLGFEDPSTGQMEIRYKYLSGNVREKLAIAEGYNTDGKYAANVEELRKAVPMDIPSHLIEFSLGSSWIPIELYKDYIKETLDLNNVKLTHVEGAWIFDEGYGYHNEKNRSAGVYSEQFRETIYGHQLVAAALNNRPVKVAKQVTVGYGDNKHTETRVDQNATSACAVRVDEIKDDFKQWAKKKMQDNPELAQQIEKIYNDKFNALVPMHIDDDFLPEHFEGSNVNISLYDHQKRGVMRGLTAPTMLAHEVGTGKSFTLISTAMEMRRLGTAKKPMIVVQNATVAQITADAKLLYPNAKVLSLTEKDRNAEGRRAFYASIKYNDWDMVIIPQSTLNMIPDSPERELQFIQEKIDEKKHVIEAAEAAGADSRQLQQMKKELEKLEQEYGDTYLDNDPANNPAQTTKKGKKKDAKKEAAALDKAQTKAKEMLDRTVDDVQYFDDLGVDALLVDEAHEYKHLGFQTSIGRGIKGIDPSYSKKCAGLYNKTRAVFEKAGWKNVVFATGTPISNTAAEIWTFMKYLMQPDVMRQNDIYYFDDFVHNFGAISQMLEFATSGKFKENTRFAAYVNKPELIRIWSQVADTVLTKEVGAVKQKVPKKEGDKDQDVFLPQSPSLVSIMAAVRAELERFENMTGKEKKENSSIPLIMYGIAKRAAIDPRLVNPDAADEPTSKTNAAVKEIVKDLKATDKYKGTVAVFCDNQNRLGKTADGKNYVEFNIYDDMRDKLIKAGVPAEQIAIIKSGMSITAKQKVFDAVNTGAIRVVLGSTQTLGTGVNMQERLHLLIHMDAPDRPMDYTQRNGRIERQGNLHKTWDKPIRILRFGVEDSLDVTAYQRLKTKSGFIDSIMDGKGALLNNQVDRTVEEEEEGLFDNPVAVLSGSQYALKKNQAERELRKYLGKKAQWEADQVYVANTLRRNKSEISDSRKLIGEYETEQARYKKMFPDGKVKVVTVEGEPIDLSKGDAEAYVKMVKTFKEKIQDPVNATVKKLRENPIYNDETLNYTIELDGHPVNFKIDVYRTSEYENGKMKTVLHKGTHYKSADLRLTSDVTDISKSARECVEDIMQEYVSGNYFTERIDTLNNKINRLNEESEQLQKRVGMEFQYGKELEEAKKHVEEYTELMKKEMEEKEAKYAAQQKKAQENGGGFDLSKAEETDDDGNLYRIDDDMPWEDDEDNPVFYSNAMQAVDSIRQDKAAPQQWLAMIVKNGGLKAGEDRWLGLSDWLNNSDKKSITKQEVKNFIRMNQIYVEETHYTEGNEILREIEKKYPGYENAFIIEEDDFTETPNYSINDLKTAVDLYNKHHTSKIDIDNEGNITDDQYDDVISFASEIFDKVAIAYPGNAIDPTRLKYTTKGLENKHEIALTVPTIEPWNQGDTVHFGDAGGGRAIAWVRFGETTADDNRVLVIDEIQSKRHQEGRKEGYKSDLQKYQQRISELREKQSNLGKLWSDGLISRDEAIATNEPILKEIKDLENKMPILAVPDAPFEKNWHELAMKRMLRYAAENGYDKIAWTTGEQQGKRYSLAKKIEDFYYKKNDDGTYDISAVAIDKRNGYTDYPEFNFSNQTEKDLDNLLGKDLAQKIVEGKGRKGYTHNGTNDWTTFKGNDLKLGAEGMKGFYDQILPRFMDKYGKKWGVSVKKIELPEVEKGGRIMWSVDVTPQMKESVMMGQPMFRDLEQFSEGETFPIYTGEYHSSYNVLGSRTTYSTDLMPDEYESEHALLDALRNQYPEYFVTIEDGNVKMQTFDSVMADAVLTKTAKRSKGTESYVERKTRRAIAAVEDMANRMNLDVEVLTSTEGLTDKQKRAKGWFNPKTHKIVIVLPNHKIQSDVINTLLHEGVAHYGLRKMFGDNFNTFLDNVYNNVDSQVKARIDAAIKRNGWDRHTATEEYLARLAERTDFENADRKGWWQKIKDFFINMLAKAGFNTILTDNELRYILWRSYDNLLHPNDRRNIFDTAKDIDMQSRLKVGPYEEQTSFRPSAVAEPMSVAEPEVDEVTQIINDAKANGTYMKAPNGKPTNLNEDQWAQVRTSAFKNWFGDWQKDPENASKVIDENGEPKVVYHNTNLDWVNKGEPFWTFYPDSHFGTKGQAEDRMPSSKEGVKTYEVFLNIRNPQRRKDADQDYLDEEDMTMSEFWQQSAARAKNQGYDGIVYLNRYEDKEHPADSWIAFEPNQIKSATDNNGEYSPENDDIRYSLRTKEPPKKTGIGYKVFVLKNGQLYPPMVANPNGEGTPVGVWLDADAAPVAGTSKTGRPQVKAGGKGTQGGSGQLAYRPGWHLGEIPYALQFNRKDENGERTLFPNNFVWAEVEYADDVDYNDEARQEGTNASGKYQHSLAGLKHVPTDGSYRYRTNPDPRTDPWIITGAMRVNKILSREEVDDLVRKAGREPQPMQEGDVLTKESLDALNNEIQTMKEADEMGLLYRSDDDWDDIAKQLYEKTVAQGDTKWIENWQDSMVSLKAIQDAIAAETGNAATGAEDAYLFENRMHGRAKNMTEQYDWRYYRPMLKAFNDFCKQNGMTHEQGMDYLIAKSGLERNVYYAFRDAAKAKITDEINEERDDLEKLYAKGRIDEEGYKTKKAELEEREQNGVDDFMNDVRNKYAYRHAKQELEDGIISYGEYLRIIERVIRAEVMRKTPKKDGSGNIVSDNYYDENAKDWSGLTETFAKEMYDAAQNVKKQAQKAVDPQERKQLWAEFDKQMRNAYVTARQVAEDQVFSAENDGESRIKADKLWSRINDATKETLKHSYESGLIDRNNYNKVRAMFDYYIPLRGWEEDKASDVYTYMGRDNVFSPAVKKVWGRTSQAENPLAYIGNIAVSTILSGHRNQMKQHFLNYVMNNPTSLVNVSESWYENIGNEGDSPVWIYRTADTAGKNADEIAQIVNDFNEEMRLKQAEGKAMPVTGRLRLDVHATSGQKSEHVVEVQRAGHTYQLYINGDPKAAQALNGTAAKAVSRISDTWLGKKITNVNRNMAAFFTSKNPAFVISNLSRDLNMAGASVAIKEGRAYNEQFMYNVAKVLRPRSGKGSKYARFITGSPNARSLTGLMPSLMRKWMVGDLDLGDETERLFGEFMDEGGETGFVNMLSVDSFKEKMQNEIREMNGSKLFGAKANVKETTIGKGLRLLGETFEFYNRCAEDATRFIVYMTSRQMGKTLEESIADAKDVTLNFNRKGTGGMGNAEVRDLFIFVNPAIQALANMYKMATGKPLKFGAVTAAFIAGGALMATLNEWMLNLFGDDDDKDAYWNLPPWVRKNNLVFWIPGTKNFVTIPLAQEFRVFYGVGEMVASAIMEHPVDRWGLEIFSSVADLVPINPTGNGGNLMVDFAPTMVQPLMQVGENIDFTGRPIWKENQGNKFAPMYSKAYVTTPTWMVKVSEEVNNLTGGNEGKKGVVEEYAPFWADYVNNPAVWNHLMQGYFGGMYNTIAKTFDVAVTVGTGNVPKIYQTPVINRFLNRPVERDNAGVLGDDYYRLTQDRDALQYELRVWQKKASDGEEGAQEHVDEILQSEDWKRAEVITHYEKIIKDLKAGEKASSQDIDKQEIKESISLYKQEMMEELAAIDNGSDPLTVARKKFDEADTFAEKNKLRMRIERLQGKTGRDQKSSEEAVKKALSYRDDEERESRDVNDNYLMLATAENIADDARIKAAKAEIGKYVKEYKQMIADGRNERAVSYRKRYQKYFTANEIIQQQSRNMNTNKKLLGKGHDKAIMKLIDANRQRMLKVISEL